MAEKSRPNIHAIHLAVIKQVPIIRKSILVIFTILIAVNLGDFQVLLQNLGMLSSFTIEIRLDSLLGDRNSYVIILILKISLNVICHSFLMG
jgi:hypothetical protein